jgi:hypothetical protein
MSGNAKTQIRRIPVNNEDVAFELLLKLQSSVPYQTLELSSVFGTLSDTRVNDRYIHKQDQWWYLCRYIVEVLVPKMKKELPDYVLADAVIQADIYDYTYIALTLTIPRNKGTESNARALRAFTMEVIQWSSLFEDLCYSRHDGNWRYKTALKIQLDIPESGTMDAQSLLWEIEDLLSGEWAFGEGTVNHS